MTFACTVRTFMLVFREVHYDTVDVPNPCIHSVTVTTVSLLYIENDKCNCLQITLEFIV